MDQQGGALMRSPPTTAAPKKVRGGGSGMVMIGWILLRFVLGVQQGFIFELLGAFILSQTGFKQRDYRTHRNADAIVFIGTIGGLTMGLILIILDVLTANSRALGDVEPPIRGAQKMRPEPEWNPNATSTRNQAALRLIIWPAYAAISGAVGTLLWHLHKNSKPEPYSGARAGTGAIVQVVGAAVSVSAPSLIQLLTLLGAGNKK